MIRLIALPLLALACAVPPGFAAAETLVATRRLSARTVVAEGDVAVVDATTAGALVHPDEAIGMETRVMLYPGRAIRDSDLVPPAIVERNAVVILIYERAGLTIAAEGRALARGAVGDRIRVMNLASRTTVTGRIEEDGHVRVGPSDDLLSAMGER